MTERTIFHIDMDAFFASIEVVRNPALKGKPVIVGGNPNRRGVVSTCSYEARKFGVHSSMPLKEAQRRCPHGIFIEGSYQIYGEYSAQIMEIFRTLTPFVESISIDEAYIDVTNLISEKESALDLAKRLQAEVYKQTALTCSIGVATNKLIAKIASGMAKPAKITHVPAGQEMAFLAPLKIQAIPGIGQKTQEHLNADNIVYVRDLQGLGIDYLMDKYGERGYHYFYAACGRDKRPVAWEETLPKSIGAETTFETDQSDREALVQALNYLCAKSWRRLRLYKMRTRGITLKLRNGGFVTITRSQMLFSDTQDLALLQQSALELFDQNFDGLPIRLIGISYHKLTDQYWQPTLWQDTHITRIPIQ
ncbi:MAG: DNA polymerase IV [Parachlamydiaceae bacterium]|nr:DNA polymerase IV [Parachlamydiaceae bacterium]